MPEHKDDPIDFHGYTLTRDQVSFMELVIDHGMGARAALKSMGRSLNALSGWLKDDVFKEAWLTHGKPMLALNHAEDASDLLVDARREILDLTGDDVKKASALANLARSRADYKFRTAERLAPKEWGPKTQIEGTVEHQAVVLLPPLAPLAPAPTIARIAEGGLENIPQIPAHVSDDGA